MIIETQAKARYVRMSPRKVRLFVDMVRGMKAEEAITQLRFAKRIAARPVLKLLESAIANALHNHGIEKNTLTIAAGYVNGGPMFERWMPRAMGRAVPIRKRTAHITLVLTGDGTGVKVNGEIQAHAHTTDEVSVENEANKGVLSIDNKPVRDKHLKKKESVAIGKRVITRTRRSTTQSKKGGT